jgi:hypothetical protein
LTIFHVKIFLSTILTGCLLFAGTAMAQTEGPQKASLNAAPNPALQEQAAPQPERKPSMLSMPTNRVSYGLSMGASFGNGFGATYIEPSVRYQLSPRLRAFGSFTYVTGMPQLYSDFTPEGHTIMRRTSPGNQYIVNAGADYLVNDRLILSGSVWKDFSNVPAANPAYNNFRTPGRQGMDFRATYKITDHFSVTGAMRYSNGPSPFYNPFLNTGFGGRSGGFWY